MCEPTLDDVACLNDKGWSPELKSTIGHHCDVWQMSVHRARRLKPYDVVIKKYRGACTFRQIQILDKDYRYLKASLEDIVPGTIFLSIDTAIGRSVIAVSYAVVSWFNLANPINESDAVPLLRKLPKARNQLMRFCHVARKWSYEKHSKVIDLYGLDNLVLNTDREIRYLDSFHVFFYTDMARLLEDESDYQLKRRMDISSDRCRYLEHLLKEVRKKL
ncbi:MAG: hypothetical protein MAG794_00610 [Gammaproteobacteria bacterium]|nr:hypothetical protein [Gammaproteobacteria bacterium]